MNYTERSSTTDWAAAKFACLLYYILMILQWKLCRWNDLDMGWQGMGWQDRLYLTFFDCLAFQLCFIHLLS